ncbi:hypothetical protein [Pseudonocardia spinosispora]|uniref:hypothetical protein n=1 Tax=Pseudonocardia spinosispora TaxID=103441 RepID=UPI0004188489|nr:hypothetical protein [Pseudonocardia spinosispora]
MLEPTSDEPYDPDLDTTFGGAAQLIANQPDGPDLLLAEHRRTSTGECAACSVYRPTDWPCVLVTIARLAQRIVLRQVGR